ncbi:MAG: ferredoxin [Candidatus Marinimicrobia bacterium]|nr:ferredoxin [Candidatus Neomarinimicrobiota bacterium]
MTKIIQKREGCIGCGTCTVLCSNFWQMDDDSKASLKGATRKENGDFELEVEEDQVKCNKDAAEACPVKIISIEEN